jgi:hypothetical protein
MPKISSIHVFICEEAPGHEGIPAKILSGLISPLVCSNITESVLPMMREDAIKIQKQTGKPMKLVKFTNMEIIEIFGEQH